MLACKEVVCEDEGEEELLDEVLKDLNIKRDDLKEVKAIEVGNIFKLFAATSNTRSLYNLEIVLNSKTKLIIS